MSNFFPQSKKDSSAPAFFPSFFQPSWAPPAVMYRRRFVANSKNARPPPGMNSFPSPYASSFPASYLPPQKLVFRAILQEQLFPLLDVKWHSSRGGSPYVFRLNAPGTGSLADHVCGIKLLEVSCPNFWPHAFLKYDLFSLPGWLPSFIFCNPFFLFVLFGIFLTVNQETPPGVSTIAPLASPLNHAIAHGSL